jgi:hypothetical protein
MDDPISTLLIERRYSEALPLVLEAMVIARKGGASEALIDSLSNLWVIYSELGQLGKVIAVLEEEVALRRHRGSREIGIGRPSRAFPATPPCVRVRTRRFIWVELSWYQGR